MGRKPVDLLFDSAKFHCSKCGAEGIGTCDCWEHCSCGWWAEKGKPCGNPKTTRCSTKLKHKQGGGSSDLRRAANAVKEGE